MITSHQLLPYSSFQLERLKSFWKRKKENLLKVHAKRESPHKNNVLQISETDEEEETKSS